MIIPAPEPGANGRDDRAVLFRNVIRECSVSMGTRKGRNRRLRAYALQGTDTGAPVRRNKLIEFVESSSAYCFGPEFVRFGVTLPREHAEVWIEELDAVRDVVGDLFVDARIDAAYERQVQWAHIYSSSFSKVFASDGHVVVKTVPDPADLGVWEEALPSFDDQEALIQRHDMNFSAYERMIRQAIPNKDLADEKVALGRGHAFRGSSSSMLGPAGPMNLLMTAISPAMIGNARLPLTDWARVDPQMQADMVPMVELWIRDDYAAALCKVCGKRLAPWDAHEQGPNRDHEFVTSGAHEWEWRRVMAVGTTGDDILWSSLNPGLPQRQPFRQLCLWDVEGYVWGMSPLEKLIVMQDWGEQKIAKHDQLLDLQLDPPIAILGMSNVDGERAKLLRAVGGTFAMPVTPGADIKRFAPDTPPDAAGQIKMIDEMFASATGMPAGSNPISEPNVRSAGQMTAGAALSSPRTTRRAMRVEDCLEEVMTDVIRLERRINRTPLHVALPEPDLPKDQAPTPEQQAAHQEWEEKPYRSFYLAQMPPELAVRVSAHSASPMFREQHKQDAIVLKREQVIGPEEFIELYDPPLADVLRPKARQMAKAAAKMRERAVKIKEAEAKAKEASALAKEESARRK